VTVLKTLITGWPLCRQCEIPWQFHDGLRHSAC